MPPLSEFPLPLPPDAPPVGYDWEERSVSALSTPAVFSNGIDQRDTFLGRRRCIICGASIRNILEHCYIIAKSEPEVWKDLKDRNWIPQWAKNHSKHDPRNGLLMCSNHRLLFENYALFIRFLPEIHKFVLINYIDHPELRLFHGKAIGLDINDHYAPFPSLFIIHEMRVRGFNPFQPIAPCIPDSILWQDWILTDGVVNQVSGYFKRDEPPRNMNERENVSRHSMPQFQPTTSGGGAPSGGRSLALNEDVISEILAATHSMPSWRSCVMEGTSWDGTADENIEKYVTSVGVQDS